MKGVKKLVQVLDDLQKRYRFIAFAWAVQKKFGDDRGGYLAALVTYYGFLSVFPLLLAVFTIVAYALSGDTSAVKSLETHIGSYPIIGPAATALKGAKLQGSPIALIVGVLGLVWGAMGLADAAQFTMDEAWNVPVHSRPGFGPRMLRGLAWYAVFGLGVAASTFVASLGSILGWAGGPVFSTLIAIAVDSALFAVSFWILTPPGVAVRAMMPGAVVAGTVWSILTGVGVGLAHKLAHSSELYGSFSTVLGLLAFLYLAARVTIYSIEANVVHHEKLWPRHIAGDDMEPADRDQLINLARREERVKDQQVDVSF